MDTVAKIGTLIRYLINTVDRAMTWNTEYAELVAHNGYIYY
jgi:hypothetical protein